MSTDPRDERGFLSQPGGAAEFDPTSEKHHPVLIVKVVEPGCTYELQLEDVATGQVTRLTSTENPTGDRVLFERAVLEAARRALQPWFK